MHLREHATWQKAFLSLSKLILYAVSVAQDAGALELNNRSVLIANLLDAVTLLSPIAVCKCKAHDNNSPCADSMAKNKALHSFQTALQMNESTDPENANCDDFSWTSPGCFDKLQQR